MLAEAKFAPGREQGEVIQHTPSKKYKVTHSTWAGLWMLCPVTGLTEQAPPLITARKPTWHSRSLVLTMGGETFEMKVASYEKMGTKEYVVKRLDSPVVTRPGRGGLAGTGEEVFSLEKNKLKRSIHTVSYDEDVPVELPVFCYWMVVLYMKRDSPDAVSPAISAPHMITGSM